MCILDELSAESLSKENILRYIDDYSIYSHYIGEELELNTRYSSPLRETDNNPSFSLFQGKDSQIFFKDYATTHKGDVFQFVRVLMGEGHPETIPWFDVLRQIDSDFHLGLYTSTSSNDTFKPKKCTTVPTTKEKYNIQVTSHKSPTTVFLNYWDKYDISKETRELYNASNAAVIHYSSKTTSHKFQIYPRSLCIAYRIGGKYEIYFPLETKNRKFQNDLPQDWIKGFLQLKRVNPFLIITKAMKEVMFFREHFDWDTVAGKSETTMIPAHLMKQLLKEYKRIYIWLDPDETGIKSQQKYLDKYPTLIPLQYPKWIQQKDVTDRYDFMKQNSKQKEALEEIKNILLNYGECIQGQVCSGVEQHYQETTVLSSCVQ